MIDKLPRKNYLAFIAGLAIAVPLAVAFFPATTFFYTILGAVISSLILRVIIALLLGLIGGIVVRWAGKKMSAIAIGPTSDIKRQWHTLRTLALFGSLMYGGMIFVLLSVATVINGILEMHLRGRW